MRISVGGKGCVELGGMEFTGATPNAVDSRKYEAVDGERALTSRDAHHFTRAPLVH